jgi:hypothetical protein
MKNSEKLGLTIEQLEERFEMVVATKGSSDPCTGIDPTECNCPCQD